VVSCRRELQWKSVYGQHTIHLASRALLVPVHCNPLIWKQPRSKLSHSDWFFYKKSSLCLAWSVAGWFRGGFSPTFLPYCSDFLLLLVKKPQIVRTRATVRLQLTKNHLSGPYFEKPIHMDKWAVVTTPRTILDRVRWSRAQVLTYSQCVRIPAERVDCDVSNFGWNKLPTGVCFSC
jgi:hypothetical protein